MLRPPMSLKRKHLPFPPPTNLQVDLTHQQLVPLAPRLDHHPPVRIHHTAAADQWELPALRVLLDPALGHVNAPARVLVAPRLDAQLVVEERLRFRRLRRGQGRMCAEQVRRPCCRVVAAQHELGALQAVAAPRFGPAPVVADHNAKDRIAEAGCGGGGGGGGVWFAGGQTGGG